MADINYRSSRRQSAAYTTSGSSALAYVHREEEERRAPTYEQRIQPRQPEARRSKGVSSMSKLLALGLTFTLLAGFCIGKRAICTGIQKQVAAVQEEIQTTREANQMLEQTLITNTDGELIRSYAVNQLGLSKLRAESIYPAQMPNTRPLGDREASDVQKMQDEEGGFLAVLADLLRQIPI